MCLTEKMSVDESQCQQSNIPQVSKAHFKQDEIILIYSDGSEKFLNKVDCVLSFLDNKTLRVFCGHAIDFVFPDHISKALIEYYSNWTWAHEEIE